MRKVIDDICLSYGVYNYHEKIRVKYEIIELLNGLMDSYEENQVHIFSPALMSSIAFYQALHPHNRQKLQTAQMKSVQAQGIVKHIFIRRHMSEVKCIIDTGVNSPIYRLMKKIILQIVNRCKVVNIYQYLKKVGGYEFESNWYAGLGLGYDEIYADYELYQKSCGTEEEKDSIKRLIGDYLEIKDFVNAEKWIKHLSERYGGEDSEVQQYQKFWNEIQNCLKEMRRGINGKEHIVVNWVDALRYDELSNMEYLSGQIYSGINFEKMYTPTPYTNAVMKALLTGKYVIDDKAFMITEDDYKGGKLWKYLESKGYRFAISSSVFWKGPFYNSNGSIMQYSYHDREWVPSTIVQFDAICQLYEAKERCFYIIHNLSETHLPFINPLIPTEKIFTGSDFLQMIQDRMGQIVQSQKYLDEQLQYYGRFYQDIRCNIYMSDHGFFREEEPVCIEGYHHVVFSICPKGEQSRSIQTMFSLISFTELVEKILEGDLSEINKINDKDYVLIERDDVYGQRLRRSAENDRRRVDLSYIQYRGVVTEEDIFVRLATGKEFYFLNDESENLRDDERYRERIDYLRSLAGNKYINIYKEKKYQEAVKLYQYKGWHVSEDIEFIE